MLELIKLLFLYKTNTMYIGFIKSAGTVKGGTPLFYWFFKTVLTIQCLVHFWNNVPNLRPNIWELSKRFYKRCFKMINISQVIVIIYYLCKRVTNNLWDISFFTLNILIASVWIFLWCIETVSSFIKSSS